MSNPEPALYLMIKGRRAELPVSLERKAVDVLPFLQFLRGCLISGDEDFVASLLLIYIYIYIYV